MLCRALLVAAVLSYVLCVLLLSGVQKEDIDAGTLRKLQRHNVNIDDINDRQVQERCLGKTDIPINLTTLQASPTTGKTATEDVGSLAGDSTPLQKIVEYLEYKQKEERRKALESKDNVRKPNLGSNLFTTLPSRSSQDQPRRIEDPSTESAHKIVTYNDDVKTNKANMNNMNNELEKLMKIWQMNIDRMSDTTKQESTTVKIIKNDAISKNTKEIEYITKIVAEIMSKRHLNDVKTSTTIPKHNFNSSETLQVEQAFAAQSNNETFLTSPYSLKNCNLGNSLVNKAGDKEKSEVLESLTKRLDYGVNSPVTNTNPKDEYVICKRFESKGKKLLAPHRIDDYTINYILNKLSKERQGINVLNRESSTLETLLENRPKSPVFNPLSDQVKRIESIKETFNLLDNESAKVLQDALENQSKRIFFNRQSGRIKVNDAYKIRLNQLENENAKAFQTRLKNQPKNVEQESHRSKSTNTFKEKQNTFPRFVEDNKNLWANYVESLRNTQEQKFESEPTTTVLQPHEFSYESAKQNNNGLEEEYKKWLFIHSNPSNKQESTMELKQNSMVNNRADDHERSRNIKNNIQYDPNRGDHNKLPWLYSGSSNEQFGHKNKEKQDGVLFKPKNHEKITNTIDPRFESVYKKIWPLSFEAVNNNTPAIPMEEHGMSKNNQERVLVESDSPQLTHPKGREVSPDIMDVSKKYPNFVGWYPNKTPYVIDDRNNNDKQFEPKGGQKINQAVSSDRQNKFNPLNDAEYKSNWAYFRNKQINKQKPNMEEEHDEETEYFINSKSTQQNNNQYLPTPYEEKPSKAIGTIENHYGKYIAKENLPNAYANTKFPTFPPNVIKDIANSVKEIVLRDLKTTTIIPITTTLTTSTPSSTTSAATTTSTTTKPTTTTTPPTTTTSTHRTTTSTTKSTTTEGTLITTKDPLKIQDASKALEKIIEIFEKISSIKDKMVTFDNDKNTKDDTTTKATPRMLKIEPEYKPGRPSLYDQNPSKLIPESHYPYTGNVQASQLNPQTAQFKSENRAPYVPGPQQLDTGNRIPYNPLEVKAENHILYESQAHQNRVPYETKPGQLKTENHISYGPQGVQLTAENHMQYNQPAGQLQTGSSAFNPQAMQLIEENRLPYNPLPLPLNSGNNIAYDPQSVQSQSENHIGFDPQPVQRNEENRIPYDYSVKRPYYHSKIEYDPYSEKEVLEPATKIKAKKARTYAITVQTNSGEIAPLKIAVKKPLVQNIVLTTKSPIKEENNSDETFNFRKPITNANRHHNDNSRKNEASRAREKKPFITRHTHRDTYLDIPKSRKIKEREFNEEYKPRDMQAIERFHEKLERGDPWPQYEEEKIAQRQQRPLVKKANYDDTHFRNFLQTQQKVNAMLEKILGAGKNKQASSEVL